MILKLGMKGLEVAKLQNMLTVRGFSPGGTDGEFGPNTLASVRAFQAAVNLPADGIVGEATFGMLMAHAHEEPVLVQKPTVIVPGTSDWLAWLQSHKGEIEYTGKKPSAFVEEVFSHTTFGALKGKTPAACAATICAALEHSNYKSTRNAMAISYLKYGVACGVVKNAVVVFEWAPGEHHVSCIDEVLSDTLVACTGGNQGHKLCTVNYARSKILATRMPNQKLVA